tara:strand:- start:408 stop:608 length:201 start_codon:yes stop_codon:yes gene_type:complete
MKITTSTDTGIYTIINNTLYVAPTMTEVFNDDWTEVTDLTGLNKHQYNTLKRKVLLWLNYDITNIK